MKRKVLTLSIVLVSGLVGFGLANAYHAYSAVHAEYLFTNDKDSSELRFNPKSGEIQLRIPREWAGDEKTWRSTPELPASGTWNSLLLDQDSPFLPVEKLLQRAQIDALGSSVRGLWSLATNTSDRRLVLDAIRALGAHDLSVEQMEELSVIGRQGGPDTFEAVVSTLVRIRNRAAERAGSVVRAE